MSTRGSIRLRTRDQRSPMPFPVGRPMSRPTYTSAGVPQRGRPITSRPSYTSAGVPQRGGSGARSGSQAPGVLQPGRRRTLTAGTTEVPGGARFELKPAGSERAAHRSREGGCARAAALAACGGPRRRRRPQLLAAVKAAGVQAAGRAGRRRWRLADLRAGPALLRARLHGRVERFDANAAFPVTGELLARHLETFEPPSGEGEELIVVSGPLTRQPRRPPLPAGSQSQRGKTIILACIGW